MVKRANNLSGKEWLKNSISVWKGLPRDEEENRLRHPAMFPKKLVEMLIDCFLYIDAENEKPLLFDPFVGSGTSLLAAANKKINGLGLELKDEYFNLAAERLKAKKDWLELEEEQNNFYCQGSDYRLDLKRGDARIICQELGSDSIDLTVTSPPYWDILKRKRTADKKEERFYSDARDDLGNIAKYTEFLAEKKVIWQEVFRATKNKGYLVVVVMDIRKKNRFYPFHIDITREIEESGFILDDIIIWDRGHEYNNLRPLGYPYVFRINKVHEFILIFQKPQKVE